MQKKDWLALFVIALVIAGAAVGLYAYKSGQTALPDARQKEVQPSIPKGTPAVQLWVTRDFGSIVFFDKQVPLAEGDTVMDVLKKNVPDVQTAYNGGFVQSINGLASAYRPGDATSKKLDWFYSVNGLMADVGATEYPLHKGDVIWWDYHDWNYAMRVPAQIAAFPHPFVTRVTGEPLPVQVMTYPGFEKMGQQLAEKISQAQKKEIPVVPWNEQLFDQDQGLVLVGDRASFRKSAFVQKLWKEKDALGLFAEITEKGIQVLDQQGKASKLLDGEGAAMLIGTKNPANEMPILIVAGNSEAAVQKAVNALTQADDSLDLKHLYGAVLNEDKWIRLPIVPNQGSTP